MQKCINRSPDWSGDSKYLVQVHTDCLQRWIVIKEVIYNRHWTTVNSHAGPGQWCRTQGSWVPGRLPYTSLRHSQSTLFTVSHSTSPNCTTLLSQHFRSSGLLCCWSDGLELTTGQPPQPGAQQQDLKTIAENEPISSLPLITHSAVEMLQDSALYKSIIDIDIDLSHQQHISTGTGESWADAWTTTLLLLLSS